MLHYDRAEATWLWLRQLVLERARAGALNTSWRDTLVPLCVTGTRDFLVDLEPVIARIRQTPYAPWEPGHAPNWQTALTQWYAESRMLLRLSYELNASLAVQTMSHADTLLSFPVCSRDSAAAYCALVGVMPVDDAADQVVQAYPQVRDLLTASYMAGLAAGGEDVDWIAWLRDRVDRWPVGDVLREQLRSDMGHSAFRDTMQQLPAYWKNNANEHGAHGGPHAT